MSDHKTPGEKPLAFIDLETTGLHPDINEIISFAGQKYTREGKLLEQIEFKIQFQHTQTPPQNAEIIWPGPKPFSPETWKKQVAWCLNFAHYDEEEWDGALDLHAALTNIVSFLQGCVVVGQNPAFDMDFIKTKTKRLGMDVDLPYHKIDTVVLGFEHLAPLGLKRLSLSKEGGLCDFLDIPVEKAHDALDDVQRTALVFFKLDRARWWHRLWWGLRWKMRSR